METSIRPNASYAAASSVQTGAYEEFTSVAHPLRIHAGPKALERLPAELTRHGMQRVLVLCGTSVAENTNLISRIELLCGDRHALTYDRMAQSAPRHCIEDAVAMARRAQIDGIIAVGAGSVTKAARVLAILLAEDRPLEAIATRHSIGCAAQSIRLLAPKCPILNVITAATTSQSRAGASISDSAVGHQWEFYDPKTRPKALFWDTDALETAPLGLARSAGMWLYWRSIMSMGALRAANPLVRASRIQAYALAHEAIHALGTEGDMTARMDLCAAAMLQTRDEDDGGRPLSAHLIVRAIYVLAVALFNVKGVNQTVAAIALSGAAIRELGQRDPGVVDELAKLLITSDCLNSDPEAVANALSQRFASLGWSDTLREYGIQQGDFPGLVAYALHNFNGNYDRALDKHAEGLSHILEAACI